ncbi:MAG: TonB-dependent receptor [Candidatus Omnitrophica bacterium]|nr:TonB-dependent receptor [Candidatus Omnitrophota bacterium]
MFLFFLPGCIFCADIFAQEPVELDPIMVTRREVSLLPYYERGAEELEKFGCSSAVAALSTLPVDLQSRELTGGIQTDFSLRASTPQGVAVLIDGQRVNDPQTAHYNADLPLTPSDLESVVVMPGVSSALYGPDAVGGAVNFVVKPPRRDSRTLTLQAGMYDTYAGLLSLTEAFEDGGVRFSFQNRESDGFLNGRDFKVLTSTFTGQWESGDMLADILAGYQEKEFGAYDFYTPGKDYFSQEWTKTYLVSGGLLIRGARVTVKPRLLLRRHTDKFLLDRSLQRTSYLNHHLTDMYTPSVYVQGEAGAFGRIGLGVEYGLERLSSTSLNRDHRSHLSVYADESLQLTGSLAAGISMRIDNYDSFDTVPTGSLSLRYTFNADHRMHAGFVRTMRIPSFTELYYNDPVTLGNPGLGAETASAWETGWEYRGDTVSFGTTVFWRKEDDVIDWVKRGPQQAKWQVENIAASRVFGLENSFAYYLYDGVQCDARYIYVNKEMSDDGLTYKYGPNFIRHHLVSTLRFDMPVGVQTVTLAYKKKPHRDGWFIVDTRFSCRLRRGVEVFAVITNLLNVEYQEIEGIAQPGRLVEAGVRVEW